MRSSPENILLRLADAEEQQIREVFARLSERGFPAQQQTPHITITFSPAMADEVAQCSARLLPALIPARLERAGTVVFGTKRKQTVAWLLEASEELESAAREISALNPDGRGSRWTPHLTMGLRLPREIVPDYIRALDELTPRNLEQLTAIRAALWKPLGGELTVLAEASSAHETRT
ncbi:2'-5' RNA ligase [Arthrobacter sp. MYb229]|uniref:2'-5' RNA ligase family protein n=1 Tax=unclassified Arthrobacter TaxID=235627 RepID=UPI000CFD6405|nr:MULTISPECIES: 2'-5' RNA ligase family protein [unclassified Arthrobacter]PRA06196.1 2'-5' RNA ligase [Arthrobacter sp. MYb229]PRB53098.1 2'-5' RNA ligase [Arthrobacter sp. MYb216]